jgi:hypothetical protein
MNAQLKLRIDEKLEHLSEQHIAEVLDFVEFLESREAKLLPPQADMDEALAQLRQIINTPPQGRLSALRLDLTGYKFNRDEANER